VLRRNPAAVGIEQPALREVAAWRAGSKTNHWGRGYIDLVGVDHRGAMRLVETKLGADDMLVLQGLDYWIWANLPTNGGRLRSRLDVGGSAPFEIHYVVGGKAGGTPLVSAHARAQVNALASDIRWRFHTVTDWFEHGGPPPAGSGLAVASCDEGALPPAAAPVH